MMSEERTAPKETDGYGIAKHVCKSVQYAQPIQLNVEEPDEETCELLEQIAGMLGEFNAYGSVEEIGATKP